MQPMAAAGPGGRLAARDMLARHPPARDFSGPARIGDVVNDEDVADEAVHLGRDVGVASIHRETMHADAAGLLGGDQLRLRRVGYVVDLEAAVVVTLRGRRLGRARSV